MSCHRSVTPAQMAQLQQDYDTLSREPSLAQEDQMQHLGEAMEGIDDIFSPHIGLKQLRRMTDKFKRTLGEMANIMVQNIVSNGDLCRQRFTVTNFLVVCAVLVVVMDGKVREKESSREEVRRRERWLRMKARHRMRLQQRESISGRRNERRCTTAPETERHPLDSDLTTDLPSTKKQGRSQPSGSSAD